MVAVFFERAKPTKPVNPMTSMAKLEGSGTGVKFADVDAVWLRPTVVLVKEYAFSETFQFPNGVINSTGDEAANVKKVSWAGVMIQVAV